MAPHSRAELVYASDLRISKLAGTGYLKPPRPPVAPAEHRRRWTSVLGTLLCILSLVAVAVAK
mgnify:CR=1 FL=1